MGKYFSDIVEKAIEDLYYCYDNERALAAADDLAYAATELEDGDACYVLARCFSKSCQSWKYHPFQENPAAVYTMLRKGIFLGSAVAVVGALRMDMLKGELRDIMPFSSIRMPWETVLGKAEEGCIFCQYLVGNAYHHLDILTINQQTEADFETAQQWEDWKKEQILEGVTWYEKAFEGGMGLAGRNLFHYYQNGREGLIAPDPAKAAQVMTMGAQFEYPDWMFDLARDLYDVQGKKEEGVSLALKAAKIGHLEGWRIVGDAFRLGEGASQDLSHALECYEKAAAGQDDPYACNQAGEMYFLGMGAERNYEKAAAYLEQSYALQGKDASTDMLGLCCLLGYGCPQDPKRGRMLLEESRDTKYKLYGLGLMYADGIGVDEDIEAGTGYLKAAGDYEPAKTALKRFKKGILGKWKRR